MNTATNKSKPIYENFRKLIEEAGASQNSVSRGSGVSQSTLSAWKTGRSSLGKKAIQKIADYFWIDPSYFYEEGAEVPEFKEAKTARILIQNDSMEPLIQSGDIVKVKLQSEVEEGAVMIIKVGDEIRAGRIQFDSDSSMLLKTDKENERYTIQEVVSFPVKVIGKAISIERNL